MDAMSSAESWGAGPANLLPFRFTDESLMSIPVLRPEDIEHKEPSDQQGPLDPSSTTEVERGKKFAFFRRKSTSTSTSWKRNGSESFTMRRIPRREYVAHYAKDDSGHYIGTEEPAEDCILRGEDLLKYRSREAAAIWKNEIPQVVANKDETQPQPTGSATTEGKLGRLFKGFKASKDTGGDTVIH